MFFLFIYFCSSKFWNPSRAKRSPIPTVHPRTPTLSLSLYLHPPSASDFHGYPLKKKKMSTLEKLFVQIFDRKQRIIDRVKHQTHLFDQHLASKLLIDGIVPPPWLWAHPLHAQPSDLKGNSHLSYSLFVVVVVVVMWFSQSIGNRFSRRDFVFVRNFENALVPLCRITIFAWIFLSGLEFSMELFCIFGSNFYTSGTKDYTEFCFYSQFERKETRHKQLVNLMLV